MERKVLITGSGSGIGLASALEAARLGFRIVAAVHRPDQVPTTESAAAAAGVADRVEVAVLDVTDEAAAAALIERTRPWGLVNNAAVPNLGALAEVPVADARRQFDVMLFAGVRLTQLALPHMRREGAGRIVNVSSIAVDAYTPLFGWYAAAKSALSTLSDVLRTEIAHFGIDVVLVEPGIIDTPIWDEAAADARRRRPDSLEPEVYDRALEAISHVPDVAADVAEAAETVAAVLHAGHPRFRYRVGAGAHVLPLVGRIVPTSVRDRVGRRLASL
jgi:NAD(P)-dependent dehydrogenase (short-subunit alcohol dehydrogenase family)